MSLWVGMPVCPRVGMLASGTVRQWVGMSLGWWAGGLVCLGWWVSGLAGKWVGRTGDVGLVGW